MQRLSTPPEPKRTRGQLRVLQVGCCQVEEAVSPVPCLHPDQLHQHLSQKHIILSFSWEEKAPLSTEKKVSQLLVKALCTEGSASLSPGSPGARGAAGAARGCGMWYSIRGAELYRDMLRGPDCGAEAGGRQTWAHSHPDHSAAQPLFPKRRGK